MFFNRLSVLCFSLQSYWDEFERPQTLTKLLWLLASGPWGALTGRHGEFFPSTDHQCTKTTSSHSSWAAFLKREHITNTLLITDILVAYHI